MKKNIPFLILIIGLSGCITNTPTLKTGLEGKSMPSFSLLLLDSSNRINTSNIPKGNPIVFFFFSPECPYCKAQTEAIISDMNSMQQFRFYFFSIFPLKSIRQFAKHYQLEKYHNIVIGQDENNYFSNYYKTPGVPYMAIFSKNKILKQAMIGNVGISQIKQIAL